METPQKKLIEKKAGSLEESGRHHGYDVGEGGNVLEQQRKEKVRKNFVYIMYMLLLYIPMVQRFIKILLRFQSFPPHIFPLFHMHIITIFFIIHYLTSVSNFSKSFISIITCSLVRNSIANLSYAIQNHKLFFSTLNLYAS